MNAKPEPAGRFRTAPIFAKFFFTNFRNHTLAPMAYARSLVLLVDDDPQAHFLHRRQIEKVCKGETEILTATSGLEAIQILGDRYVVGKRIPSHIFLDLQMPQMNGFEFLKAFESLPEPVRNTVAMYVVTSSRNPDDHTRARSFGTVRDVIDKGEVASRIRDMALCNGI